MEKTTVVWEDEAKEEFRDIWLDIYENAEQYADKWAKEVEENVILLERFPEMGRIVPELNVKYVREIFVGNYRVIYTFLKPILTILAIRHTSRPLKNY